MLEDIQGLGAKGDIVEVKDGYARNYLIPKKLALAATPSNLRALEAEERLRQMKEKKEREKAEKLAKKLSKVTLTISLKVGETLGEEEKVFGSVGPHDILQALKEKGFELDKGSVLLDEPIKELGTFKVPVRLYRGVEAKVEVKVVKRE